MTSPAQAVRTHPVRNPGRFILQCQHQTINRPLLELHRGLARLLGLTIAHLLLPRLASDGRWRGPGHQYPDHGGRRHSLRGPPDNRPTEPAPHRSPLAPCRGEARPVINAPETSSDSAGHVGIRQHHRGPPTNSPERPSAGTTDRPPDQDMPSGPKRGGDERGRPQTNGPTIPAGGIPPTRCCTRCCTAPERAPSAEAKGALTWGGGEGTRTPNPLLANSGHTRRWTSLSTGSARCTSLGRALRRPCCCTFVLHSCEMGKQLSKPLARSALAAPRLRP